MEIRREGTNFGTNNATRGLAPQDIKIKVYKWHSFKTDEAEALDKTIVFIYNALKET